MLFRSGQPIGSCAPLVQALAMVKQAAAQTNASLGHLSCEKAQAIVDACQDILKGRLHDQFVVDVIQGGAGTSTNMNANEVIANRALNDSVRTKGRINSFTPSTM